MVHQLAARGVCRQAADDLVSDVFAAACSKRDPFSFDAESALPWLYRIALRRQHKAVGSKTKAHA